MELLQQQPSEISLSEDSTKLILQERSQIKWLLGMLALWAVIGVAIASVLVALGAALWIAAFVLAIALAMDVMTVLSWVVVQTFTFDAAASVVTSTQKGVFGRPVVHTYALGEIMRVQLVPKTANHAWSYYISLKLTSGRNIDIDLSSNEAVDREIVRSIQRFLISVAVEAFIASNVDQIRSTS
jgi:hypothetical protein